MSLIVLNYVAGQLWEAYPSFAILIVMMMGLNILLNAVVLRMHSTGSFQVELSAKEIFRMKLEISICTLVLVVVVPIFVGYS